jgi:tRNA pseudouridine38-40 synthase
LRFFFHLAYKGTAYSGWQKHPGVKSIQETLETTFSKVLKENIEMVGCGRTDAGVHASQFFFHCDIAKEWDFDALFRINKSLPADIALFDFYKVSESSHARFDAYSRTYQFYIHTYKDPFLSPFSSCYELRNLNYWEMEKAVKMLVRYQDYAAFCKSPNKYEHTLCFIHQAEMKVSPDEKRIQFKISSNRFLSGMIRILVNKILDIGTGYWTLEQFEHHLVSKMTPDLIKPAHPEGLYLTRVLYPYLDIHPVSKFLEILEF